MADSSDAKASCCGCQIPTWLRTSLIFGVFASMNIGLNEFNPWALKPGEFPGFEYPVFYGMWHMLVSTFSSLLLLCTVARPPSGLPSFRQLFENPALFVIALCGALNVSLNNFSFLYVALFVNQVIKACQPLPTIVLEFLLAKKTFSIPVILSVCFICVGAILAPYYKIKEDSSGSTMVGVVAVVISMLATSLKPVVAMIMMDGSNDKVKLTPLQVLFYDCGLSFWFMLAYWLVSAEREPSIVYMTNHVNRTEMPWLVGHDTTLVGLSIIITGSLMAFTFNLSTYAFIQSTSALTSTVGSLGLKITILCVSAIQVGISDPISISGIGIVVASIVAYVFFSNRDKAAAKKAAAAPDGKPLASESTPLKQ